MHSYEFWLISRTPFWPVQKVPPGELKAVGRHWFKTLCCKPAQHPSYFKWTDSKCAAAATIFKKLNPHTGWIKKGSSPYAKPEAIGREFFPMGPRDLCQVVASEVGLLFPDFMLWTDYWSLRDRFPTLEPTPSPLSSFPKNRYSLSMEVWRYWRYLLPPFLLKQKCYGNYQFPHQVISAPFPQNRRNSVMLPPMAWGTDEVLVLHKGTEDENCH